MPRSTTLCFGLLLAGCTLSLATAASEPPATVRETEVQAGKVVASGTVPDGATKAALLGRLREVYGATAVVDNLSIDNVVMPPNWSEYVQRLITPELKAVRRGSLSVDGTNVAVRGEVASEAERQQLLSTLATRLNPTYVVKSGLRTVASSQAVLDTTLANRIVEFEPSKSTLTPAGAAILDEMVAALQSLGSTQRLLIVGHTDASGNAASNRQLSLARANAVKAYFEARAIDVSAMEVSGAGAARPVAPNTTAEGRARNRRIEFRVLS